MHKYSKGPAAQLIKYEQTLIDLIQPITDENEWYYTIFIIIVQLMSLSKMKPR